MIAEIKPRRFIIVWFIAGILVMPTTLAGAGGVSTMTYRVVASVVSPDDFNHYWNLFGFVCLSLISGAYIGLLQKAIVRRYLHIELRRWRVITVLGSLLAGSLVWEVVSNRMLLPGILQSLGSWPQDGPALLFGISMLTYLLVLSAVQTVALRHQVKLAWRWIAAHIAAAVLAPIIELLARMLTNTGFSDGGIYLLGIAPITAAVTGIVMFRLLLPSLRGGKLKRDQLTDQSLPV